MLHRGRPLLGLLAVLVLGGCGARPSLLERAQAPHGLGELVGTPAAAAPAPEPPPPTYTVARVLGSSIPVFANPGDAAPARTMSNPNEDGQPRVFLVRSAQPGWLEVLLPMRPNGSRGWIREADVSLTQHQWRILVELGAHRITVWNGAAIVVQEPVGIGTSDTPTPGGDYYITEMLRPPDPGGPYGPYAFGLSAYSEVLHSFAGGPGIVGLHGTNSPSGLGRDVSHGCIRMTNASIVKLANSMPIGTPISIVV